MKTVKIKLYPGETYVIYAKPYSTMLLDTAKEYGGSKETIAYVALTHYIHSLKVK